MTNATIAVFAKEPVPGTVKTRLIPPFDGKQSAKFAGALINDAICMVERVDGFKNKVLYYYPSSGIDYFKKSKGAGWAFEPQKGKDLGERLSDAFYKIIKKNSSPVVIIGTDSPGLPTSFIHTSIWALKKYDIVIGPSRDGGFYLIGVSGYFPQLLKDIRWSTPNAYSDIIKNINSLNLTSYILPEWFDIDNIDDIHFFIKKMKGIDEDSYSHTKQFLSKNTFTKQLLLKEMPLSPAYGEKAK